MLSMLFIHTNLDPLFWWPRIWLCILPFSAFFLFFCTHLSIVLLLVCNMLALCMWLWEVICVQQRIYDYLVCPSLFITFWWDPCPAHMIILIQLFFNAELSGVVYGDFPFHTLFIKFGNNGFPVFSILSVFLCTAYVFIHGLNRICPIITKIISQMLRRSRVSPTSVPKVCSAFPPTCSLILLPT